MADGVRRLIAIIGCAFLIVALSEWLAARARFVPPVLAFLPALDEGEPAPYVEAPPRGPAALEPGEDTEPEALTIIAERAEHGTDPWEQQAGDDEPEPELAERGMFRRRRR